MTTQELVAEKATLTKLLREKITEFESRTALIVEGISIERHHVATVGDVTEGRSPTILGAITIAARLP